MAVQQCVLFSIHTLLVHERTVRSIAKYVMSTSTYTIFPGGNIWLSTHRIVYSPNKEKYIECFVDADFAGGWSQVDSDNVENSMSCTVYVIAYVEYPVLWYSKLHTELSLSTTQVQYITLSQAMPNVIPCMLLIKKTSFIFDIHLPKP